MLYTRSDKMLDSHEQVQRDIRPRWEFTALERSALFTL
jgi:hypothetical protein